MALQVDPSRRQSTATLEWSYLLSIIKRTVRDFPSGPEMKASPPNAGSVGLIPCWGAKILHASDPACLWVKNPNHKTEVIL